MNNPQKKTKKSNLAEGTNIYCLTLCEWTIHHLLAFPSCYKKLTYLQVLQETLFPDKPF